MKIVWEQKPEYLEFANKLLNVNFLSKDVTWLASVDDGDNILGVVVYSRFSRKNCEMSVAAASPKFLNKRALKAFFGYPFYQLGCNRVTAVVETTNRHALEFDKRLGFRVEGLLQRWFENSDGIIMGLLKEECKWL